MSEAVWQMMGVVVLVGVLVVSIALHEMGHGLMAWWLGDDTAKRDGRLSLNPAVHFDWGTSFLLPLICILAGLPVIGAAKPVPVNWDRLKWREMGLALVAVAGPMMNLLLAVVIVGVGHVTGWMYVGGVVTGLFMQAAMMNLSLMVFNLIPVPPLDGSRVLYLIAPDSVREILKRMEGSAMWMMAFLVGMMVLPIGEMLGGVTMVLWRGLIGVITGVRI